LDGSGRVAPGNELGRPLCPTGTERWRGPRIACKGPGGVLGRRADTGPFQGSVSVTRGGTGLACGVEPEKDAGGWAVQTRIGGEGAHVDLRQPTRPLRPQRRLERSANCKIRPTTAPGVGKPKSESQREESTFSEKCTHIAPVRSHAAMSWLSGGGGVAVLVTRCDGPERGRFRARPHRAQCAVCRHPRAHRPPETEPKGPAEGSHYAQWPLRIRKSTTAAMASVSSGPLLVASTCSKS
jgi:hypothetical protein